MIQSGATEREPEYKHPGPAATSLIWTGLSLAAGEPQLSGQGEGRRGRGAMQQALFCQPEKWFYGLPFSLEL